jgi:hypothetical protein
MAISQKDTFWRNVSSRASFQIRGGRLSRFCRATIGFAKILRINLQSLKLAILTTGKNFLVVLDFKKITADPRAKGGTS